MIDLFSDTKTRPTPEMRKAIYEAEVGDDHFGEDPTVAALSQYGAELLGFEAALFLPSATMGNQIAIKVHARPGDSIICHEYCHINLYEGGTPAFLSGVMVDSLPGERGVFTGAQVRARVRPTGPYFPPTSLVCIENTHNYCGGTVWNINGLTDVATAARESNLALHLDGSRIFNAAVKLGVDAKALTAPFDSVTLCLSKGLGAPAGALLFGSRDFVEAARRWKHSLGGAMRQSGIIAAGGLYALEHHIPRLADDHARAEKLAAGIAEIPGLKLDPWPETNLVFVDPSESPFTADEIRARLKATGVLCSGSGTRLRFVTHLDISDADIDTALTVLRDTLSGS
ncbi:MAG: GntG family PLP-dependent aldolase [Armatimonas sp.]